VDDNLRKALMHQYMGFKQRYGCYPEELRRTWNVKVAFNTRFPNWRLCWHKWCLRFETNDYRCEKHQDD